MIAECFRAGYKQQGIFVRAANSSAHPEMCVQGGGGQGHLYARRPGYKSIKAGLWKTTIFTLALPLLGLARLENSARPETSMRASASLSLHELKTIVITRTHVMLYQCTSYGGLSIYM